MITPHPHSRSSSRKITSSHFPFFLLLLYRALTYFSAGADNLSQEMHSRWGRGKAWRAEVSIDGPENLGQSRVVMRGPSGPGVLIYDSSKGRGAGQIGVCSGRGRGDKGWGTIRVGQGRAGQQNASVAAQKKIKKKRE